MWIPLKAEHLNTFKNSFNWPYKYGFLSILNDRIIGFSCLSVLNIWFNVLCGVRYFDYNFKKTYWPQIPTTTILDSILWLCLHHWWWPLKPWESLRFLVLTWSLSSIVVICATQVGVPSPPGSLPRTSWPLLLGLLLPLLRPVCVPMLVLPCALACAPLCP